MRIRTLNGWENPYGWPWGSDAYWNMKQVAGGATSDLDRALRDNEGEYAVIPITLHNNNQSYGASQIWGYPDGVYFISGFSNTTENTMSFGGSPPDDYVIFQDTFRTGFSDYIAIKLDA